MQREISDKIANRNKCYYSVNKLIKSMLMQES